MKALSIKQPWAWLICAGYKDIENRDWRIGRKPRHGPYSSRDVADFGLELPCRIYVHAGKTDDHAELMAALGIIRDIYGMSDGSIIADNYRLFKALGAIIGEVDITGCVEKSDSPWFVGKYGFTLANPALYEKPIPYRGQLGFFEVKLPFDAAQGKPEEKP